MCTNVAATFCVFFFPNDFYGEDKMFLIYTLPYMPSIMTNYVVYITDYELEMYFHLHTSILPTQPST